MDDTEEKMTALKKAYADIILNTAKEAAARILVAERKASRCERELSTAKEEALHMLLRLKQLMDSKIREAETASLSQQKKIEELEAQLQEAEDIVGELRTELRAVQDEQRNYRSSQSQPLDDRILVHYDPLCEVSLGGRVYSFEAPVVTCNSQLEPTVTPCLKDSTLFSQNYATYSSTKDSCLEDQLVSNLDMPSIISRNKKTKLYRNGCTQRIHAFEGNTVQGNFAISEQFDDRRDCMAGGDENFGGLTKPLNANTNEHCRAEKNPNDVKKLKLADKSSSLSRTVKSFLRRRKRVARYRKTRAVPSRCIPKGTLKLSQVTDLSSMRISAHPVDDNPRSGESPCKDSENETRKDLKPLRFHPHETERSTHSGHVTVSNGVLEFPKACMFQKTINSDNNITNDILGGQQRGSAERLSTSVSKTDLKTDNAVSDSELKEVDVTSRRIVSQANSDRFIKYTFQRKRKKESSGSGDESVSCGENPSQRKKKGKQQDLKAQVTSSTTRESRRLAQVARQLISLSEKRW